MCSSDLKAHGLIGQMVAKEFRMQRFTPLQVRHREMWALSNRADQMRLSTVEIQVEAVDFATHSLFGAMSVGACTGEMCPLYRRSGPTLRQILV